MTRIGEFEKIAALKMSMTFDPSTDIPVNMGRTSRRGPDLQVNMDATPWGRPTIREFKTLVGKSKEPVKVDEIMHERGVDGDYALLGIDAWNYRGNKDMREMKDHNSRVPRSIALPLIRPGQEEVKWKPRAPHSTNIEDRGPNAFDLIRAKVSEGVKLGGMPTTLIDSPSGPNTRLVQTDLLGLKILGKPTHTISAQTGVANRIFQNSIHTLKVGGRQGVTGELTSGKSVQPIQSLSVKLMDTPHDYVLSGSSNGLNTRTAQGISGKQLAGNHFVYVSEKGTNIRQPQTSLLGKKLLDGIATTLIGESGIKTLTQTILKDPARTVTRISSVVDAKTAPIAYDGSNMAKMEKVKAELQYTESQVWDTRDNSDHGLNSRSAGQKTIVTNPLPIENSQTAAPLRGAGFQNFITPRLKRDLMSR